MLVVRRTVLGIVTLAVTLGLLPSPAPAADRVAVRDEFRALMQDSITANTARSGPDDERYFAGGVWHMGDPGCWTCQVGPGTAAATLWKAYGDPRMRTLAVETFDTAIREHRNANGSLGDPADSPDIATMFFGLELGNSYIALRPTLGSARARRWRATMRGAADYLIANGNLGWYTNGNVTLGNAMLFQLTWQATGLPRFRRAYETAFRFALRPPAARWPGRGIQFLVVPRHADGRDGAAYLSEAGDGAPGFDPEYTQVQADMASRLYMVSGDRRALRLSNLLLNAVLSRTDSGWALHTGGGTRKRTLGRQVPLMTPALAVTVLAGGRSDLAGRLDGQLARIDREYRGALNYSHRSFYRGLGGQASVIFQAATQGSPRARRAAVRPTASGGVDRAERRG